MFAYILISKYIIVIDNVMNYDEIRRMILVKRFYNIYKFLFFQTNNVTIKDVFQRRVSFWSIPISLNLLSLLYSLQ
jgi:hypothetical protein